MNMQISSLLFQVSKTKVGKVLSKVTSHSAHPVRHYVKRRQSCPTFCQPGSPFPVLVCMIVDPLTLMHSRLRISSSCLHLYAHLSNAQCLFTYISCPIPHCCTYNLAVSSTCAFQAQACSTVIGLGNSPGA